MQKTFKIFFAPATGHYMFEDKGYPISHPHFHHAKNDQNFPVYLLSRRKYKAGEEVTLEVEQLNNPLYFLDTAPALDVNDPRLKETPCINSDVIVMVDSVEKNAGGSLVHGRISYVAPAKKDLTMGLKVAFMEGARITVQSSRSDYDFNAGYNHTFPRLKDISVRNLIIEATDPYKPVTNLNFRP